MTTALAEAGFEHVARPMVVWREDEYDLGFGQQYLAGGSEGGRWPSPPCVTSTTPRVRAMPAEAGGDFAAEAERLGRITAEMHLALADVFG